MLGTVDGKQGVACGWIAVALYTGGAATLIADEISETDTSSEINFYHVANYTETACLKATEVAVTNTNSWE